jgi:hypothetical protein
MIELPSPHTLLPPLLIKALQKAAATPITPDDPLARIKALEQATQRIKRNHPELFKTEEL